MLFRQYIEIRLKPQFCYKFPIYPFAYSGVSAHQMLQPLYIPTRSIFFAANSDAWYTST